MFTPKTALFTFFAACAVGVVACQPTDGPAETASVTATSADPSPRNAPPSTDGAKTAAR